jgi:NAD(P)-dependent dehydrogenase (short-subunit alcohol dehydrogenase family)
VRGEELLDGKCAIVTGAGIGIGRGIAEELARRKASVVLHYAHSRDGAEEAVSRIIEAGGRATAIGADLARVSECLRLVDEGAEFLGGLDILVNNAGITKTISFLESEEEDFNLLFNVNIRGQYFCAQQAARHMIKRGGGSIVNITSVHAFSALAGHSIYAATKGAIVSLTRELAIELIPQRIRVNAVAPGMIEVPRHRAKKDYTREKAKGYVPWGRVGFPADIAKTVAFLVSDDAELIVGQALTVDGGLLSKMATPEN